jgi:hypothetical protein
MQFQAWRASLAPVHHESLCMRASHAQPAAWAALFSQPCKRILAVYPNTPTTFSNTDPTHTGFANRWNRKGKADDDTHTCASCHDAQKTTVKAILDVNPRHRPLHGSATAARAMYNPIDRSSFLSARMLLLLLARKRVMSRSVA